MQPTPPRRIAVFGGTFDPVHLGHLITAEQCREQARLDEVWFMPAARPPHKRAQPLSPFDRRAEMLALAVAGQPAFKVATLERDRPGLSYTVETLQALTTEHPEVDWHFVMGSDSLVDLPGWYQPQRIVALARLLVVVRPGVALLPLEELQKQLGMPAASALRLQVIEAPLIGISSTDLRRRVSEGRGLRYLVPRAVECYIEEKKLYQSP
jgi:nicotinate-nucleotide adenylyltransferase